MPTMPLLKLSRQSKSLIAFLLIPLLIVLPASLYITYDNVMHNLRAKAQTYINRMDDVITQLHQENQQAMRAKNGCMAIREELLETSQLRELILLKDNLAVCSSKRGVLVSDMSQVITQRRTEHSSMFFFDISNDPHQRTMVVIDTYPSKPDSGALALVDKSYLIDRLGQVANDQISYVTFKLGNKTFPQENPFYQNTFSYLGTSSLYGYSVLINANSNYVFSRASYTLFFCLLLSLAISGALLLANHHYRQRHSLAYDLRKGIQRQELFVMYQPIIGSQSGDLEGLEALVRWKHPDMNLVRPDIFVPLAERQNLVNEITNIVLEETLDNLKQLAHPQTLEHTIAPLHIGINVAPQYLHQKQHINMLIEYGKAFSKIGFSLTIEITERQVLDAKGREALKTLRQHGIRIAIDDFGTGHTSLSVIQQTEFDYLKIDKCFVDTIGIDTVNAPVLNSIIDLAHRLKVRIIAEGVEDASQADYLKMLNVHLLQGYLYSRPVNIDDLKKQLTATS